MSAARQHLRLVPYDPSDYTLGEVLAPEHGQTSEDPNFIGACFSLYFQWEDYRGAAIYAGNPKDFHGNSCSIGFDPDERAPTELYIKLNDPAALQIFSEFQKVFLRFEVFRVCYQFDTTVLAVNKDPESQDVHWFSPYRQR